MKGEQIALPVRVIEVAYDAEIFHRLGVTETAIEMAKRRAGGALDPAVVETFARRAPQLLSSLGSGSVWEETLGAEPGKRPVLSGTKLDEAVRAAADFADLKSLNTVGHSSGVAELVRRAAHQCRLPESEVVTAWRAALLHDIGRVGVSIAVWNKPGALTHGEWEQVRLHPYYTQRVLDRPHALRRLGDLGSLHHERLTGPATIAARRLVSNRSRHG